MTSFDILDEIMLKTDLQLFGRCASLYPKTVGAAGPNARSATSTDPDRSALFGVRVIRSEWSARVQIGGQGMPTPAGAFRMAARGVSHVATVMPKLLDWVPKAGDELVYDDRPDDVYRLTELMHDGGAGLHCGLAKV